MKSKKFTLIDAIIILGIIVAGFFVAKTMIPSKTQTNGSVEFVIMASSVSNEVASELEKIQPDSLAVLSHVEKTDVKIKEVKTKPHEAATFNYETNEHSVSASTVNSDVYITVSAAAQITDTKIKSGDVFVRVGNKVSLTNKNIALEGYVVDILSEEIK